MEKIIIEFAAEHVLTLNSKSEWISRVPRHLPGKTRKFENFLFLDSNGCVLECGMDFESAERICSYPVKVYKLKSVHEYESEG